MNSLRARFDSRLFFGYTEASSYGASLWATRSGAMARQVKEYRPDLMVWDCSMRCSAVPLFPFVLIRVVQAFTRPCGFMAFAGWQRQFNSMLEMQGDFRRLFTGPRSSRTSARCLT